MCNIYYDTNINMNNNIDNNPYARNKIEKVQISQKS